MSTVLAQDHYYSDGLGVLLTTFDSLRICHDVAWQMGVISPAAGFSAGTMIERPTARLSISHPQQFVTRQRSKHNGALQQIGRHGAAGHRLGRLKVAARRRGAARGGDPNEVLSSAVVGDRLLGGFPQLGSQPTEGDAHATSAKEKASRGEGRVGAGQECRPGDQGMMGGRRTQSSDCYGRALDRFFTCRAGARPCYSNGPEFCAAKLHVFASP